MSSEWEPHYGAFEILRCRCSTLITSRFTTITSIHKLRQHLPIHCRSYLPSLWLRLELPEDYLRRRRSICMEDPRPRMWDSKGSGVIPPCSMRVATCGSPAR